MNHRIFITGATGFLGKHLLERLRGNSFYLYSRGENPDVLLTYKPDVIIHAAGEIYDEKQMFDTNIKLTKELLDRAINTDRLRAFLYIGSSSEYGRKTLPMRESDVLEPTNLYEATKGAGTLLVQAYAKEFNLPAMVARPFSLYGKYEPEKRFIPTLITAAKAGWELKIAPGVHDFIHVDDFIGGLQTLIENPNPGEVFNFGSGIQRTNEQVVDIVEGIVGRKVKRVVVPPMHKYDSDCWVSDTQKARNLGWNTQIGFYEGIRELCHLT